MLPTKILRKFYLFPNILYCFVADFFYSRLNVKAKTTRLKSKVFSLERKILKKMLGAKKILVWKKYFGLKKFWVQRKFEFKMFFGSDKISSLKTLGPNENLRLEKVLSKNILVHKNYDPKKLGPKSLVKIGPETA